MAIVVGQWRMLSHNDIMSHTPIIHLKKADNSCERWLVASSHLFCLNWNLLFWLTHGQTPRIGMGSSHFLSDKRTRTPSEKRRSKAWVFIFTSSFVSQYASYPSLELFPFSHQNIAMEHPAFLHHFLDPFLDPVAPARQQYFRPLYRVGKWRADYNMRAGSARWCPVRDLLSASTWNSCQ